MKTFSIFSLFAFLLIAGLFSGCRSATSNNTLIVQDNGNANSATLATATPTQPTSPSPTATPMQTFSFTSPKNKTYAVAIFPDDDLDTDNTQPPPATGAPSGENYIGTARKAAKLSIVNSQAENLGDLQDLINSLPSKQSMTNHNPSITTDAGDDRISEEKRNVHLRAWLYAAKKEDNDNDYHLIIGRDPESNPSVFMTMEVSGLPPTSFPASQKLRAVRTAFNNYFGYNLPTTAGYSYFEPAIPIEVEGSLFFDMSHATGQPPGPQRFRDNMPVIWEVHPISKIVFEP